MNSKWKRVPIKTVYTGLFDGPHATPKPSDEGPVFLGIKNLTDDGHFDFSEIRHIAEEDFPKWTRRIEPQEDDIVFTYEATLNRYALIPPGFRGCLGRRLALIRPDKGKVDPRFLFLYMFSEEWRRTIASKMISGATVDRIPLIHFPDFPVSLPDLPTQQKIASVLSCYDDLIENNTRRIAILEEMAQALYREWFVRFRFPGHESTPLVPSPLGDIPQGWRATSLKEMTTKIGSGATPRGGKESYMESGISLIRSLNVYDNHFDPDQLAHIDDDQAAQLDNVVVEKRDILLNITGASVARCCMVPSYVLPARVNQHVAIVRVNPAKAQGQRTSISLRF